MDLQGKLQLVTFQHVWILYQSFSGGFKPKGVLCVQESVAFSKNAPTRFVPPGQASITCQ